MKKFDIFLILVCMITLIWIMFQIRPFEILLGCFIIVGIGVYFLMKVIFDVDLFEKNHYNKGRK